MSFTPVNDGDLAVAPQLQQLLDALQGVSGAGQPISLSALDDDVNYALTVRNLGAGGLALDVRSSADAALLQVNDGGVIFGGSIGFPSGTASAPAIFPSGDTNTGLYWPAADQLAITLGGSQIALLNTTGMTAPVIDKGGTVRNVKAYGAMGDCQQTVGAVVTSGSAVVTTSSPVFSAADVGKRIRVMQRTPSQEDGVGTGTGTITGTVLLDGTITTYGSTQTVTCSAAATASGPGVSGTYLVVEWGTDDTAALQAVFDLGGTIIIPDGRYLLTGTLYVGDGSATANSTIQNTQLLGSSRTIAISGNSAVELGLVGFPQLVWCGPVAGTVLRVLGPIANCRIANIGIECSYWAGQGLQAYDLQHSTIENCKAVNYTAAGLDLLAYSYGDAGSTYPPTLISALGSAHITVDRWIGISSAHDAIGISVGPSTIPAMPPLTSGGAALPAGFGPDIHEYEVKNCTIRQNTGRSSPNATCGIGLRLQFTDGGSFRQCSFAAAIPLQVNPPTSATGDATAKDFPNDLLLDWVFLDNGNAAGAWNACSINGTWTAPHKFTHLSPHSLLDSPSTNAPTSAYGWGLTSKGGAFGDWRFANAVTVVGGLTAAGGLGSIGGVTETTGDVTATVGNVRAGGGKLYYNSGATVYRGLLFNSTLDNTGTAIDLGARFGTLAITNISTGQQAEFYLSGPAHSVTQKSNTITGFTISNAGDPGGTNIAVYWDGSSAYKIKNHSATNPSSLRVWFEGTDS